MNAIDQLDIYGNACDYYEITYLAIGSFYSNLGGCQQYPPFLANLMDANPSWHLNIILVDPVLENPPHITTILTPQLSNRITLGVSRRLFCHQLIDDQTKFGKREVDYLVNRTLNSPIPSLLLVHDFTGYSNSILSAVFRHTYGMNSFYRQRCLVDIGYGEETGCFFDMRPDIFSPLIYLSPQIIDNQITPAPCIFDPHYLTRQEIVSIMLQRPSNPIISKAQHLIWNCINRSFDHLRESLAHYRYFRLELVDNRILDKTKFQRSVLFSSYDPNLSSDQNLSNIHTTLETLLQDLAFFEPNKNTIKQFMNTFSTVPFQPYHILTHFEEMIETLKAFFFSSHIQYDVIKNNPCLPLGIILNYQ
jgi:hypothetical protein